MIRLPEALAGSLPRFGDHGKAWRSRLPGLVDAAAVRWGLEVGPPFEPGGVTSWVAPATTTAGTEVVLKVVVPHDEAAAEGAGLAAWAGQGAVRLREHDPESWTLLLERVGPGDLEQAGKDAWLPVMLDILTELWSAPVPEGVPAVADAVASWPGLMRSRASADHYTTRPPVPPGHLAHRSRLHRMPELERLELTGRVDPPRHCPGFDSRESASHVVSALDTTLLRRRWQARRP